MLLVISVIVGIMVGRFLSKSIIILTTDPPHAYMVKALKEQLGCAQKAGFVIKPPTLRVIKPPYVFGSPYGYAKPYENIITVVYFASYETIGHELGHIIDYQTGRKGHPFFDNKKDWNDQVLADAVRDVILNQCKSIN